MNEIYQEKIKITTAKFVQGLGSTLKTSEVNLILKNIIN